MPTTVNYSWETPVVGGNTDTWGAIVNAAFDAVDASLKTVSNVADGALAKSDNLAALTDAGAARTNLGLVIGTDVLAYNANLSAIGGLTFAADRFVYATGANTFAIATLTATGRSVLSSTSKTALRTFLELGDMAQETAANYGALAAANTWAQPQTFTLGAVSRGNTVARVASGTATNSGRISWGTAAPGTLAEGEIYLQYSA